MDSNNKQILFNTIVMYARLIITTIVGILTSRFVLQALGSSDYGLYSVVGGLIAMLNVLSTAMSTTTRRFINVEMGKETGNLNRVFNIIRNIHIGFAFFILIIAETIGLFYIYHYLNVEPGKLDDAVFVFQISTIAAIIGIINVPYQSLLEAFEKFTQVAILDIVRSLLMLAFVVLLIYSHGNVLRIYAIGMSSLTLFSLTFYTIACFKQWPSVVKYKWYGGKKEYKEIVFFNNYVALGAFSYLSRTQASTMLVNYFFGTLVNSAFAIAYVLENHCVKFVSNIGAAATPQITKNYENNNTKSVRLTELLNRLSIYLMLLFIVPLSLELDFVLNIWLRDVPEGAFFLCQLTLISALARVCFGGLDKLIQASGKIRWFQIISSVVELSCIPICFILYKSGLPDYTVIIAYTISTLVNYCISLVMMQRILGFNVLEYLKSLFPPVLLVMGLLIPLILFYSKMIIVSAWGHLTGIVLTLLYIMSVVLLFGLKKEERAKLKESIIYKIQKHNNNIKI